MENNKKQPICMEGAELVFKNFAGKTKTVRGMTVNTPRRDGTPDRNFGVVINDMDLAQRLINEGWNVKQFHNDDPDVEPEYWLPVKLTFRTQDHNPSNTKVMMINPDGSAVRLFADTVSTLDRVRVGRANIIIAPFEWSNPRGESGITAYTRTLYCFVEDDDPWAKDFETPHNTASQQDDGGLDIESDTLPF